MKYDARIDAEDLNSSHGLVVKLIGSGRRVLDVGCANGQLAEILQHRGNEVSGVELDPGLAELAKSHVGTVLVGDVEHLDLVAEFGPASFDVVVFADVLEHLRDPLSALRQARELLADGGFVVASIPNIAHGAVRLALLQGRFDYREVGLLDDTHIRFFTRSTVDSLLRSSGFVISEWHQTTRELFVTEIPLSPGEFSPEIVDRVNRDPDSLTYQFVVRGLPIGSPAGEEAVAAELDARSRQLEVLRSEVAAIARALCDVPRQPVVGLIDSADLSELDPLGRLRTAVVLAELRRRLVGFVVRVYGLRVDPYETGLVGEPTLPILPWDPARLAQVQAEAGAVVILGGTSAHPDLQAIVDDLVQAGCPLYRVISDAPSWSVAAEAPGLASPLRLGTGPILRGIVDPLTLIGRLVRPEFLLQRADYLTLLGMLPETTGFVLAYLPDFDVGAQARSVQALESVARRAGADLVVIDSAVAGGGSSGRTLSGADLTPVDLLATMAAAGLVITDSPALLALATGLARPALGVADGGVDDRSSTLWPTKDQLVGRLDELVALAPVATADSDLDRRRDEAANDLDLFFDDLAGELLSVGVRQLSASAPHRLAELTQQVGVLESVNAGLRQRLVQERSAIASFLGPGPHQDRSGRSRAPRATGSEGAEIQRLQEEIATISATRTMRLLQPARHLYSRLRTMRR